MKRLYVLFVLITIMSCHENDDNSISEPISVFELLKGEWRLINFTSTYGNGVQEPIFDALLLIEIMETNLVNLDNPLPSDSNGTIVEINADFYGDTELESKQTTEFRFFEPYGSFLDVDLTITDIDNIGISDDQFVIVRNTMAIPTILYVDAISKNELVLIGDGFWGNTTSFYYNRVD